VPAPAQEPLSARVLVVYNAFDRESRRVAEYYASRRGIPRANLCALRPSLVENREDMVRVKAGDFVRIVRDPIRKCLERAGRDHILYIVFSYQTPYKIAGAPRGEGISLDQYVADIWDEAARAGRAENPYFALTQSRAGVYPAFVSLAGYRAQPGAKRIYSVWRLDAATPALARGLVDKALEAERTGLAGRACLDRRFGKDVDAMQDSGYGSGDWDLHRAAQMLRGAGLEVVEDANPAEFGTPPAPARCDDAVFYAGWYSLDSYNDAFTWKTGAIGYHLDSASAANPRGGKNWAANAVLKGLTATTGALDEPSLLGLPHADGLVHDLLAGANVGDAFLRNTRWLKWMIVNLGDPLYRPRFLPPSPR
jgi:uncharacterized protein (TIGR03790 family)